MADLMQDGGAGRGHESSALGVGGGTAGMSQWRMEGTSTAPPPYDSVSRMGVEESNRPREAVATLPGREVAAPVVGAGRVGAEGARRLPVPFGWGVAGQQLDQELHVAGIDRGVDEPRPPYEAAAGRAMPPGTSDASFPEEAVEPINSAGIGTGALVSSSRDGRAGAGGGRQPGPEKKLGELLDEAACAARQAEDHCGRGELDDAEMRWGRAAAALRLALEEHAAILGQVLRHELEVREAEYSDRAAAVRAQRARAGERRRQGVKELLESEASYLSGLVMLEDVYHAQILADLDSVSPVVVRSDEHLVFAHVPALLGLSRRLLNRLRQVVPQNLDGFVGRAERQGGQAGQVGAVEEDDALLLRVADAVEQAFDELGLFSEYVARLDEAMSVAARWSSDDASGFLAFQEQQTQPLSSLLILPFQRVTRYPLILDTILTASEALAADACVCGTFQRLVARAKRAAAEANASKACGENLARLRPVLQRWSVSGNLRCVWQGSVAVVAGDGGVLNHEQERPRRFYIFDDGMLVSEEDGPAYAFGDGGGDRDAVRRELLRVEEEGGQEGGQHDTCGMTLYYACGAKERVRCASVAEKEECIKVLHLADARQRMRQLSWASPDNSSNASLLQRVAAACFWGRNDANSQGLAGGFDSVWARYGITSARAHTRTLTHTHTHFC